MLSFIVWIVYIHLFLTTEMKSNCLTMLLLFLSNCSFWMLNNESVAVVGVVAPRSFMCNVEALLLEADLGALDSPIYFFGTILDILKQPVRTSVRHTFGFTGRKRLQKYTTVTKIWSHLFVLIATEYKIVRLDWMKWEKWLNKEVSIYLQMLSDLFELHVERPDIIRIWSSRRSKCPIFDPLSFNNEDSNIGRKI